MRTCGSWVRPLVWLAFMAAMMVEWNDAQMVHGNQETFCARPANIDMCWFRNKASKRYLRFGRALEEKWLRFGRAGPPADAPEDDGSIGLYKRFLRFGRSAPNPPPSMLALLDSDSTAQLRKRRDVSEAQAEASTAHAKAKRQVPKYLRFGRSGAEDMIVPEEDNYLRQVRNNFPRFGKRYLRFGRGGTGGYLHFGKRADETEEP